MRLIPAALVLAFTIYCVVDVVRSQSSDVRRLPQRFWVVVILIAPLAGGVAWLVAGRPRSTRLPGTAGLGTPRSPVLGPDDDPDFLRSIDRPGPVAPAGPLPSAERPRTAPAPDSTGATSEDGDTDSLTDAESDDRSESQADDRTVGHTDGHTGDGHTGDGHTGDGHTGDGHTGGGSTGRIGTGRIGTGGVGSSGSDTTGRTGGIDDSETGTAAETDDRRP